MFTVYKLLLIALGGAAGTLARYGTSGALLRATERAAFPLGTLAVNVVGCLAMGYLQGLFGERWLVREEYRLAVLVGFLGGYTTFSTFGWETVALLQDRQYLRAGVSVLTTNLAAIGAVVIGYRLGQAH